MPSEVVASRQALAGQEGVKRMKRFVTSNSEGGEKTGYYGFGFPCALAPASGFCPHANMFQLDSIYWFLYTD